MRYVLLFTILLAARPARAQFPIPVVAPSAATEALAHAPDGSLFAMGIFSDSVALEPQQPRATLVWESPNPTGFLARFGTDGVLQWAYTLEARRAGFNDPSSATPKRIVALPDGGVVLLGVVTFGVRIDLDPGPGEAIVQPPSDPLVFVVRYDAAGAYVWHQVLPITGAASTAHRMGLGTDGDAVYVFIPPSPDADPGPPTTPFSTPSLVALNASDGATRYAVDATPPGALMVADDLVAGGDGVYVLGYTGNGGTTRFVLSRHNAADGALSWRFIPTAGPDRMTEMDVDAGGTLYVAGPLSGGVALNPAAPSTITFERDANGRTFAASYTPAGALRWGAQTMDNVESFGGGFAVGGAEALVAGSGGLRAYSTADGSLLRVLPAAYGTPRMGAVAATGSHVTVYTTQGFQGLPAGAPPTSIVALRQSDLTLVSSTVASEAPASRDGIGLGVPAPHPVAGTAEVRVTLAQAADAQLALFDVLGRRVAVPADGPLAAGAHALPLETRSLPAGPYLLVLDADGRRASRLITVVR